MENELRSGMLDDAHAAMIKTVRDVIVPVQAHGGNSMRGIFDLQKVYEPRWGYGIPILDGQEMLCSR